MHTTRPTQRNQNSFIKVSILLPQAILFYSLFSTTAHTMHYAKRSRQQCKSRNQNPIVGTDRVSASHPLRILNANRQEISQEPLRFVNRRVATK